MRRASVVSVIRQAFPVALGGALAIPVMAACYSEIGIGTACSLQISCDTTDACSMVDTIEDESAYTTSSEGIRDTSTPVGYLCWKEWRERDLLNQCVVPKFCAPVVNGAEATGGLCPVGPPQ